MFVNLSNHPSEGWSTEQLKEAGKYGSVVDIAFPQVDTKAGSEEINDLVVGKYNEISSALADKGDKINVVMVEGEFVFTCRMVTLLKEKGIKTVAAVTARETSEEKQPDGSVKKISKFRFEGFREY